MANHDFGSPCNCRECRTTDFSVPCPSCHFETTVSYVQGNNGVHYDRTGVWGYDFKENKEKGHTLNCFKCGYQITDVPYYEEIEERVNQKKLDERTCEECGKKEFESFRTVEYKEWDNKTFCLGCIEKKIKSELINPSTENKRFKLNMDTYKYELTDVRMACKDCGRKRWVSASEQWKKQCLTCYKKQRLG